MWWSLGVIIDTTREACPDLFPLITAFLYLFFGGVLDYLIYRFIICHFTYALLVQIMAPKLIFGNS